MLKWYGFYSTTTWDMYEKKSPLNFGGFGIKIFHLEGTGKSPLIFFCWTPATWYEWPPHRAHGHDYLGHSSGSSGSCEAWGKFQLSFRPTTRCSTASSSCNCSWSSRCFHGFFFVIFCRQRWCQKNALNHVTSVRVSQICQNQKTTVISNLRRPCRDS